MKGYKIIRTFLVGNLCGVIIAASVTFVFAIPGNSDYWRMEIWKRGGGAWTFDKNGKINWMWMIKPVSDVHPKKPVIAPSSQVNPRTEWL
jgi:gas vesicle protein